MEEKPTDPIPHYSLSPRWNSTTKLVVAITFVAIIGGLLLRFRQIVGPLLIAVVLAYLIYPLADRLRSNLRFSWRISVTILYLLVVVLLIGLLTLGGLALLEQIQNLIKFLEQQVRNFPTIIQDLAEHPIEILGLFRFELNELTLQNVVDQLLGMVQPLLTYTGTAVGALATGAAAAIGWTFFAILVSYFLLADSGGIQGRLINVQIPGYIEDIERIGEELGRIWNAFLRGQLTIILITIALYSLMLGTLGVNYYFGLALLAGLARFVPYVGPAVAWTTYGAVSYLQTTPAFGMESFPFALLVVGLAMLVDFMLDNYVTPRLMGTALEVHPAAVMIAAIISANLFGIIGMVLAAPVLATLKLFGGYALRKMFDQDPWVNIPHAEPYRPLVTTHTLQHSFSRLRRTISSWSQTVSRWLRGLQRPQS